MRVWEVGSGDLLANLVGATSAVGRLHVTADGRGVAADQSTIRHWDLGTGGPSGAIEGAVRSLAVTGDGAAVAGGPDGAPPVGR